MKTELNMDLWRSPPNTDQHKWLVVIGRTITVRTQTDKESHEFSAALKEWREGMDRGEGERERERMKNKQNYRILFFFCKPFIRNNDLKVSVILRLFFLLKKNHFISK